MLKNRVIAVILDSGGSVVQSIKFNHTNTIHSDTKFAVEMFCDWNVDEIVLLNVSKKRESRKLFLETLRHVVSRCFVPVSAGGWVDDEAYAKALLQNGADKLVINSALIYDEFLVTRLCDMFGSQCIIASIDGTRMDGSWKACVNKGTKIIESSPSDIAKKAQELGVGEIFYNCIENDGARGGYDLEGLEKILACINIPLIAFGGVFSWDHLSDALKLGCDAVGVGNQFHYQEHAPLRAKKYLHAKGYPIRL